jgi:AcrR family transcriptional regulator
MSEALKDDRTEPSESLPTQEALMVAGLKCFAERGYTGARLSDIVEETGLTTGAFYRHFSSKLEFFHVLFMAYGEELQSALAASATFTEQVAAWIEVARRHRGTVRASAEVAHTEPTELEARRRLRDACAGIIAPHLEAAGSWREARSAALLLADVVAQYVFMEAAGWVAPREPEAVAGALGGLVDHGLYLP